MKILRLMLVLIWCSVVASLPAAWAHGGHDHKVIGTVTMAAADHVMVKTKDGKDVTIQVTSTTKVTRGKQAMKVEDIKAGTRVVVTALSEKDQMKAKLIQVGADARVAAK
jgi:hypothetical protein